MNCPTGILNPSPIVRLCAAVFALILGLAVGLVAVAAEVETFIVRPGATVIVKTHTTLITADGTLPVGAHIYSAGSTGPWLLGYTAAADAAGKEEQFAYKIGDVRQAVRVLVSDMPDYQDPNLIGKAAQILFAMLVVAIILESALALLFNWRVFLEFFDGRGVRSVIMFAVSFLVVWGFKQDFVGRLFEVYVGATGTGRATGHLGTMVLTALVLAGGSAGVNKLMVALGVRDNRTAETVVARPPKNMAWVSISAVWTGLGRPEFEVLSLSLPPNEVDAPLVPQLLGVIGNQSVGSRFRKYFWRDVRRVPMSGGLEVTPGQPYAHYVKMTLGNKAQFRDTSGTVLNMVEGNLEPRPATHTFADGAIVDFVVTFT